MKNSIRKNLVSFILIAFIAGFFCFLIPEASLAIDGPDYFNPVGSEKVSEIIGNFLVWVQALVGGLAVLFIVIGGVLYVIAGTSSLTNLAKAMITWALVGFAIAVAAPSILLELKTLITGGASTAAATVEGATPLATVLTNVMSFLLILFGVLSITSFVISGVFFVTSGGDSGRAGTARKVMIYSIIGVSVAGGGGIIIKQVLAFLGG